MEKREEQQRRERAEAEEKAREEAKERVITRLVLKYQDEDHDEDSVPPGIQEALARPTDYRKRAEEQFDRMRISGSIWDFDGQGTFDIALALSRLPSEIEEAATNEERMQREMQRADERRERRNQQHQENQQGVRGYIHEFRMATKAMKRRHRAVSEDVLMHILARYRAENLSLTRSNDPTHDHDPLYPYLNWNQRAKEIVREVVLERKGEFGRQVVEEVKELERQLLENDSDDVN